MKGTYFQKPFEFQLSVEGESWRQGTAIRGILVIKNHGAEPLPLAGVRVSLAHGRASRVKQKAQGALKILASVSVDESLKLPPGAEERLPWGFQLDRNAPITDKSSSLYLLYGPAAVSRVKAESGDQVGLLRLVVEPDSLFEDFLRAFQIQHHCVVKSRQAGKGSVDVKLVPPESKGFAAIDHLDLNLRFGDGDRIEVGYLFVVKSPGASAAGAGVVVEERRMEQVLERTEYLTLSGRVNHERMEAAASEVFQQLGAQS